MRRLILGAAVALVATAVAAPPASAESSVALPKSGSYTITGHGFGHGHGMSQYGAQGAAKRGLSYGRILSYYYPGTKVGTAGGSIRVLISADRGNDTVVKPVKGLAVRDMRDGKRFTLPVSTTISKWRIIPFKGSSVGKVQYYRGGTWRRWALPGRTNLKGDGQFEGASVLTLVLPGGSTKTYRSILRNISPSKGSKSRATVNVPTIENYVRGVIAAEMPSSWHANALRSQAVAARTYARYIKRYNLNRYYQICDTTACQVYGGVGSEQSSTNAAVAATKGRYVSYQGHSAFTQFSSSSGGYTAKGSVPYLTTKKDVYDGWSGNPVHTWKTTLSASRIQRAYPKIGRLQKVKVLQRNGAGDWGGRVVSMRFYGSKGYVTLSGDTMRSRFGLRSNWFKFS